MLRVGLTGNIGSGKSTVARIFEVLGVPVFYSDVVAKRLYSYPEVRAELGSLFPDFNFYPKGKFDKAALASLVFSDNQALHKLNQLIHPLVEQEFLKWTMPYRALPYIIHESAILFENKLEDKFDRIVLVVANEKLRVKRVMVRDEVVFDEVKRRIANQLQESVKRKLADLVIENEEKQLIIPQVVEIDSLLVSMA